MDSRFSCNICLDAVTEPVVTQCGHLYCWSCLYRWLEPGILPHEREAVEIARFGTSKVVDTSRRCCPVCKAECSVPTLVPLYIRNELTSPTANNNNNNNNNNPKQHGGFMKQVLEGSEEHPIEGVEGIEGASTSGGNSPTSSTEQSTRERRLRFRSNSAPINTTQETPANHTSSSTAVPSRPLALSPHRRSPGNPTTRTPSHVHPIVPPVPPHRPSLSHGLALSLWQTLFEASSFHQYSLASRDPRRTQPPSSPQDDEATQFLSRLLLMLGSFVLFCLIMF